MSINRLNTLYAVFILDLLYSLKKTFLVILKWSLKRNREKYKIVLVNVWRWFHYSGGIFDRFNCTTLDAHIPEKRLLIQLIISVQVCIYKLLNYFYKIFFIDPLKNIQYYFVFVYFLFYS